VLPKIADALPRSGAVPGIGLAKDRRFVRIHPDLNEVNMESFLNEKEVAEKIKVSLGSLRRWRLLQRGPRFVKVGALVRYRVEDLEQWMETLPTGGTAPSRQEVQQALASSR
jgi:predicted DNA-binding transcriptional regulator AlpA